GGARVETGTAAVRCVIRLGGAVTAVVVLRGRLLRRGVVMRARAHAREPARQGEVHEGEQDRSEPLDVSHDSNKYHVAILRNPARVDMPEIARKGLTTPGGPQATTGGPAFKVRFRP